MRQFFAAILALMAIIVGSHLAAAQVETTPEPAPVEATPLPPAGATPTIDRLAAPPTVYPPTQADDGAQLFWLYCQPCHGDKGQGLTDEWRAQYPEEDQYCWGRGCHAETPYLNGFTLPTVVPAVIGGDSLFRYATMGQVFHKIRGTMPLEYPGKLTDEEYLAITAFLARSHGVWDGTPLTIDNVEQVRLRTNGTAENSSPATPTPPTVVEPSGTGEGFAWAGIITALLLAGGGWLWLRHR